MKRLFTHLLHRHAVGEYAHLIQHHPFSRCQRAMHARGVLRLDANHLDLGPEGFDVSGDARDQAAAAHGDEDGVDLLAVLAQDLHGDGALAGNHVRSSKGWT